MVHHHRRRVVARLRLHGAQDERGAIMIMVAIFMVMMLAFAALVIDLGNARQQRRQMKATADASAVAGVEEIATLGASFTGSSAQWLDVVDEVKAYAQENFGVSADEWGGCTDPDALAYHPDPGNACISADYSSWPTDGSASTVNRLRVHIPERSVKASFGGAVNRDSVTIAATSVAAVTRTKHTITSTSTSTESGGECALCVLGDGLALDGQNGDISVSGGDVIVNSDPPSGSAASLHANGHVRVLNGGRIGGPGGPSKFSGSGFSPSPEVLPRVEDPLAGIPACGTGSTCPTTTRSGSPSTLNPGIYSSISGSHTLNPGIYVLKGNITLNGNDLLRSSSAGGVMIYFACSNYPAPCSDLSGGSGAGARIKATGNGAVLLSPPTEAQCATDPSVCPYVGLTLFADRNNTSTFTFRGNGTNESGGTSGSSGTIYFKSGTLDLRGNGYTLSSMVVVDHVAMDGNPSGVTIYYNQTVNVPLTHTVTTTTSEDAYSYDASGLVQ